MTSFNSVTTSAARIQDLSLNPQKLAGQCAKLKCCMNYEVDLYAEAQKQLPPKDVQLETKDATFFFFKADILRGLVSYSSAPNIPSNLVTITAQRAKDIIAMNKRGEKPLTLDDTEASKEKVVVMDYENVVGQDDLTRFDKQKKRSGGKKRSKNHKKNNSNA